MSLRLLQPSAELAVSLDMAKLHLRVDSDDEDPLILQHIRAAQREVERQTRRALTGGRWELALDRAPSGRVLELPRPPLRSVESITYTAPDGSEATLPPEAYVVDTRPLVGRIVLAPGASWPALADVPAALRVVYDAGYETVPEDLQDAILLIVGHRYANREDVVLGTSATAIPQASQAILNGYRGEMLP